MKKRRSVFYLIVSLLFIVKIYLAIPQWGPQDVGYYIDIKEQITIRGTILTEPDVRSRNIYVVLETSSLEWRRKSYTVNGKVLVKLNRYPEYDYGDLLEITGRLQSPDFFRAEKIANDKEEGKSRSVSLDSYSTFLAKDEIFAVMYDPKVKLIQKKINFDSWSILYVLKDALKERIEQVFPEPAAGLTGGVLLGLRRGISQDVMADFSTAGLTHILAISGYNITLLITIFGSALKRFRRSIRFWATLTGIFLFAILTGLSASVIRASLMGILVILSQHLGRKSTGLRALLISGGLMVFVNPWIVIADISFQLSFLATLGLLIFMPRWEKFRRKLPPFIGDTLVVTLAAQVFTTPVILMNFQKFSIISPIANLLFLPLIPLLMFSSFVAMMSSFLWLPWTPLWVSITWIISEMLVQGVHIMAQIPFASIIIENFNVWMAVVYYALIVCWLYLKRKKQR